MLPNSAVVYIIALYFEHTDHFHGSVKIAPPPENCPLKKFLPRKFPPRKSPPMKIDPYENTHLWNFPPLKTAPLKIALKKIITRKLTPRKLSPMKVATIVVRNWNLLPSGSCVVMKNKAWWPVWWSWVSWKYRCLFNLTWIVVVQQLLIT